MLGNLPVPHYPCALVATTRRFRHEGSSADVVAYVRRLYAAPRQAHPAAPKRQPGFANDRHLSGFPRAHRMRGAC